MTDVKGFFVDEGRDGPAVYLSGPWHDGIRRYMLENDVKELVVNYAWGWKGTDLSFLADLEFLEDFVIKDWRIKDISPIHSLPNLRNLSMSTICKTAIDFTCFSRLEYCFLTWSPKRNSIFECVSLKNMFIQQYKGKDTGPFANLINLKKLTIVNSPVYELQGLSNLDKLRILELHYLRKLPSLSGLETLSKLASLRVGTCRKIERIDEIDSLASLKILSITNLGEIESLVPIANLRNIRELFFAQSTNILDGDLNVIETLPKLKRVGFQNRKHYSHRREEFAAFDGWRKEKAPGRAGGGKR